MGLISLLGLDAVTTGIVSEGIKLVIMLISNLSKISGIPPDDLKAAFEESYNGLKSRKASDLPDV